MAAPSTTQPVRIVFLTRDPVLHAQSGSTTYVIGLLRLLRAQGAEVMLVCTGASSRSPRVAFRQRVGAPAGVRLVYPGYIRIAGWYLAPWRLKAWARLMVRGLVRLRGGEASLHRLEAWFGSWLYTGTWDLTAPAKREQALAVQTVERLGAEVVIANYCLWGPLLGSERFGERRTAILMHDRLAARTQRFQESGTPLDMPPLHEGQEFAWLSGADVVLAAQAAEAEAIRPHVSAEVVVKPVVLTPREPLPERVVAGRCLFVGSDIEPNRSALRFLLDEVWPRVRAAVPHATLTVAGTVGRVLSETAGRQEVRAMGVAAVGVVPDLTVEYAQAAVCCVPLRLGTGIKIKLLEALEHGKAIVSTGVGVEGLAGWAEDAVCVADTAEAFARAIITLLTDERARREQEAAAHCAATRHFGPQRALDPAFRRLLFGSEAEGGAEQGECRELTGAAARLSLPL